MNKMRKKRKRRKLSKLLKSFNPPKTRKPIAPPTKVFPSKKTYNRNIENSNSKEQCFD